MKKYNLFSNYIYIVTSMKEYNKGFFYVSFLLAILQGTIPMAGIVFPKLIIDQLYVENGWTNIVTYLVIWFLIQTGYDVVSNKAQKYLSIRRDYLGNEYLFSVYKKMASLDMEILDDPKIHTTQQKALDVANRRIGVGFADNVFSVITSTITLVMTTMTLIALDISVFIIVLMVLIFNLIVIIKNKKIQYDFFDRLAPFKKENQYYLQLLREPAYVKEMKMYSLGTWVKSKYDKVKEVLFRESGQMYKEIYNINMYQQILNTLQDTIVYGYLAREVVFNNMSIGNFTLFHGAISTFSQTIQNIMGVLVNTIDDNIYLSEYRTFMEIENKIATETQGQMDINKVINNDDKFIIKFDKVFFNYLGSTKNILDGIDLKIEKEKFYVIVGENGAGKTTLVNLLCRLYDPSKGSISINDVDIKGINYKEYRDLFGVVFQDYQYYAFNILENIMLENYNEDSAEDEYIKELIKIGGLSDKVDKLDKKLLTPLKKIFSEDGIELSGGESQKLAIVKSLYKNADLFILDEPSSALDAYAEDNLINVFKKLKEIGKTVILISHRLSVCNYADEVIFIEDGKIAAKGKHDELMANNKSYSQMYNKQASHYK